MSVAIVRPLRLETQDLETEKALPQDQRCTLGAIGRKFRKPRVDVSNFLLGLIDFSSDSVPMQSAQVGGLKGVHVLAPADGRKARAGCADEIGIGGGAVLLQPDFTTSMPFLCIRRDAKLTASLDMLHDVA